MIAYLLTVLCAAFLSFGLIASSKPFLQRYALARPNARSSHKTPTSQGGGIAVILSTLLLAVLSLHLHKPPIEQSIGLPLVFSATILLAFVGAVDDMRVLAVGPRLALQGLAVAIVVAALPTHLRILPIIPWWIERACFLLCGVWFVNLVNFMDGIDWMTVAEMVPLTAGLAFFGSLGFLPTEATILSAALCGALVGFAPFNKPVAALFLGDVGSLPIGLLVGWLLALFAENGHLAAALLLPLYYIADSGVTLLRRLCKGESILQAHRRHFYQRALDGGLSVFQIVSRVLAINLGLIALAALTLFYHALTAQLLSLAAGSIMVAMLLRSFDRSSVRPIDGAH